MEKETFHTKLGRLQQMQPKTKVIIEAVTALSAADDTETAVITEENLTPSREHFSKMAGKL